MTERERQQAKRIRQLIDEVQALKDRLEVVEGILTEGVPDDLVFELTRSERDIYALLRRRGRATREQIHQVLYAHRPPGEEADLKIIDVFVCKMRRKIPLELAEIRTIRGVGYELIERSSTPQREREPA